MKTTRHTYNNGYKNMSLTEWKIRTVSNRRRNVTGCERTDEEIVWGEDETKEGICGQRQRQAIWQSEKWQRQAVKVNKAEHKKLCCLHLTYDIELTAGTKLLTYSQTTYEGSYYWQIKLSNWLHTYQSVLR